MRRVRTFSKAYLIALLAVAACTAETSPSLTIDPALASLKESGTAGVEYSIWLGPATGPAWYRHNPTIIRPAASAIKTALAIEFIADRFEALDSPLEAISTIVNDPDAAAIQHFDETQKLAVRQDLPGLTARQLVEAMLHSEHVNSNAAYNAAANVIIEYLGGPAASTERIHRRFPSAKDMVIARYMLTDRYATGDNLLSADALATVLQHLARSAANSELSTTVRAALLLESDAAKGRHFYKGGTLSSLPQVRIEAGWWERDGKAAVYVVIATRDNNNGGTAGFEKLKAKLGELSSVVQTAGVRLRDAPETQSGNKVQPAVDDSPATDPPSAYNPNRNAYFGDLHVHTKNSSDAFMFKARATPDDAYRYALGDPISHALGFPIQLRGGPLDFAAVTDHGELLGVLPAMADTNHPLSELPVAKAIRSDDRKKAVAAFFALIQENKASTGESSLQYADVIRSAWQETIEAAERYNQPGLFTTFVGYEYTSSPENQNLHRNVIFQSANVPDLPFSSADSENPEDLWRWLDELRDKGMEALAIPHNSNVSNGLMFDRNNWAGHPMDASYAALRMRNEPLVEVTQVKGTSETHPLLSPNDEWAGFELYDTLIASPVVARKSGGFVREAYRQGLTFQDSSGFNPYKFGLIGASDTHNGGGSYREDNYFSKAGALDGSAELRGTVPNAKPHSFGGDDAATAFTQWGASGLAGIWAEENTRAALFSAMQRKETFATSGPRIRIRFFAGYDFGNELLSDPEMISKAYQQGVPMGSDLHARGNIAPSFLLWAAQDANGVRLQRLQVIKGWIADGKSHEAVYDVICSDELVPDSQTHRCPTNNAAVDLSNCAPAMDKGAVELKTVWQDPEFDARQHAFYYVRVLENPSCRWSTWDALRAGAEPKEGLEVTIQERAWSSPIWILP